MVTLSDVIVSDIEEHQQDMITRMANGRCESYEDYKWCAAQVNAFEVAKNIVKQRFKDAEEAE